MIKEYFQKVHDLINTNLNTQRSLESIQELNVFILSFEELLKQTISAI